MCHLILGLPVFALPVLWLFPIAVGGPVYAAVVLASGAGYWLMLKAMRNPVTTGMEALLHAIGTVRAVEGRSAAVWVASELWLTEPSSEALAVGDPVEVVGREGLRLVVKKIAPSPASPPAPRPLHAAGEAALTDRAPAHVPTPRRAQEG